MVSLRLFAVVLTTLVCREVAGDGPTLLGRTSLLATLGVSLGFGILFKSFALATLSSQPLMPTDVLRAHGSLLDRRRWMEILWCWLLPATLLATGWGKWLNTAEDAGLPQSLALLGYFAPTLCVIFLLEMTAAQFDEIVGEATRRAQNSRGPMQHWKEHLALRLRLGEMAGLLSCMAPVLLIALIGDLTYSLSSQLSPTLVERKSVTAAATCLTLVVLALVFPSCLSRLIGAQSIVGSPLADRIAGFAARFQVRGLQTLSVPSGGRWAGAAIVGWVPGCRKLWLGDALVSQLSSRELDMVILHELAHVIRKHFLWRTLPVLASTAASMAAWLALQHLPVTGATLVVSQALLCGVAGIALMRMLGTAARRCELDADHQACRLAMEACEWTQDGTVLPGAVLGQALEKLLRDVPNGAAASWLHPSLRQRLDSLAGR